MNFIKIKLSVVSEKNFGMASNKVYRELEILSIRVCFTIEEAAKFGSKNHKKRSQKGTRYDSRNV